MDKMFGGGLGAKPPEAERFLLFRNWFMVVWDIVFGWKKYRPDGSAKDYRPYPPLSLSFDYWETPLWGPGAEPMVGFGGNAPEDKHFLASERVIVI